MAVDTNYKQFSSDWTYGGITIHDPDADFQLPMFIAMDPPKHDAQRKVVSPIVAPENLHRMESLIRGRVGKIFDELAAQRRIRLGRSRLHRTDDSDAGHAVRFSLGRAPQADPLVRCRDGGRKFRHCRLRRPAPRRAVRMRGLFHAAVERTRERAGGRRRSHLDARPWRIDAQHGPHGVSGQPDPSDRRRQRHDP